MSGSGLGTFILAPLVAHFNQEYGWRVTLLILSGVVLNCAIFGCLFRPLQSSRNDNKDKGTPSVPHQFDAMQDSIAPKKMCCKNISLKVCKSFINMMNLGLLKDPIFVLFAMSDFATSMGYYVPYFCLADHATELGVSREDSSHLLSIIGIVNTLSRIIWGYISDKPWMNRLWIYNISLIVCGIGKMNKKRIYQNEFYL